MSRKTSSFKDSREAWYELCREIRIAKKVCNDPDRPLVEQSESYARLQYLVGIRANLFPYGKLAHVHWSINSGLTLAERFKSLHFFDN